MCLYQLCTISAFYLQHLKSFNLICLFKKEPLSVLYSLVFVFSCFFIVTFAHPQNLSASQLQLKKIQFFKISPILIRTIKQSSDLHLSINIDLRIQSQKLTKIMTLMIMRGDMVW